MKFDAKEVEKAAKAIEDLCLKCSQHSDSCYVAIAKRSIATVTVRKDESEKK